MNTPAKRPSFETAGKLLEPTRYDPRMPRPVTIVTGAVLVLVRAVVGALAGLGLFGGWDGTLQNAGTVLDMLVTTLGAAPEGAVAATIGMALVEVVLAVLIFAGWNAARVLIMVVAVVDITVAFAVWLGRGGSFAAPGDLLAVAVDVLVLLALSSRSAAAYARRNERRGAGRGADAAGQEPSRRSRRAGAAGQEPSRRSRRVLG